VSSVPTAQLPTMEYIRPSRNDSCEDLTGGYSEWHSIV
jgi:hypothetical protein